MSSTSYACGSPASRSLLSQLPALRRFCEIGENRRPIACFELCATDQLPELYPDCLGLFREVMANGDLFGTATAAELSLAVQCVDGDNDYAGYYWRELMVRLALPPAPPERLVVSSTHSVSEAQLCLLRAYLRDRVGLQDTYLFLTVPESRWTARCRIFHGKGPLLRNLLFERWLAGTSRLDRAA